MKVLVIHAHTSNRGDEAAVKAMVDELLLSHPDIEITISINGSNFYPKIDTRVKQIERIPIPHSIAGKIDFKLLYLTNGKLSFIKKHRQFIRLIKDSDLVIHAPGGPSIGDIYIHNELLYLQRLKLVNKLGTKYMFYAPSMGPFVESKHSKLRKEVLSSAERIILRDPISVNYLKSFINGINVEQALDSALQHDVNLTENARLFNEYTELKEFMARHDKCLGVTVTELTWHPKYKSTGINKTIRSVLSSFIKNRIKEGYGIIFIPQLYGKGNDTDLMKEYVFDMENSFIVEANNPKYDTYFQQYVIGKLYAVVGMRYHSNIFSAKMGTPFISISYEQKMAGFMQLLGMEKNCIKIDELSIERLETAFSDLTSNYTSNKQLLEDKKTWMKTESGKSTEAVLQILKQK